MNFPSVDGTKLTIVPCLTLTGVEGNGGGGGGGGKVERVELGGWWKEVEGEAAFVRIRPCRLPLRGESSSSGGPIDPSSKLGKGGSGEDEKGEDYPRIRVEKVEEEIRRGG